VYSLRGEELSVGEIEFERAVEVSDGVEKPMVVSADVTVTPRGKMYADENGEFGPETFDVHINDVEVIDATGFDVWDGLTPGVQAEIRNEIERKALK
jgi:hypothetical protein